jgi:hypothetical protein
MTTNQQIILNTLLEQQKATLDSTLKEDDYFHLFVTEQVLKNFELSYDELEEGIVDNGGDGGIDSIYTFVNTEKEIQLLTFLSYNQKIPMGLERHQLKNVFRQRMIYLISPRLLIH